MNKRRSVGHDPQGGGRRYCVQVYSTAAALVREFYLDAAEHNLPNIEAAEDHLRRTLAPCDFASTVTLMGIEHGDGNTILQFDLRRS
jgi:hypothetical protein